MKKFTAKNYAQALMEAIEGASAEDENKVLDNFVKVLAENNDLRMHEAIADEFHALDLKKKGIVQVKVESSHALNHENEKAILNELNKLVKGNFEIKKKIDEQLIGGVVIQIDDRIIDASVKNHLEQLKDNLIK
jgi:F-type H+-transporting ATPase subunit delta